MKKFQLIIKDKATYCALFALLVYWVYGFSVYDWPGASLKNHSAESYIVFNIFTDMSFYLKNATGIMNGTWPNGPFFRAPLYSFILAGLLFIKNSILWIAFVQSIVSALTVWLTCKLGERLFNPLTGIVAALGLSLYGGYTYFVIIPHTTVFEVFLTTLCIYQLYRTKECLDLRNSFLYGIVAALLCLIRPNFLVIAPIAYGVVLFEEWKDINKLKPIIPNGLICIFAFFLLVAPFLIYNNIKSDKLTLYCNNAGTFQVGNSYDSLVYNYRLPTAKQMPLTTLDFWRHQGEKTLAFIKALEYPQNVNFYLFRLYSITVKLLLVNFGLIISLFVAGSIFYWKRYRKLWPLLFFTISYSLTVIAFFIVGRFKQPVVPAMLILGSAFLVRIIRDFYKKRILKYPRKTLIKYCLTILIFLILLIYSNPCSSVYTLNSWALLSRQYFLEEDLDNYYYCQEQVLALGGEKKLIIRNLLATNLMRKNYQQAQVCLALISKKSKDYKTLLFEAQLLRTAFTGDKGMERWLNYLNKVKKPGHIAEFYLGVRQAREIQKKFNRK